MQVVVVRRGTGICREGIDGGLPIESGQQTECAEALPCWDARVVFAVMHQAGRLCKL